jgi:hypothetical protein
VRQIRAYRIVFESVEQPATVDAQSDAHAVGDEVALEHSIASHTKAARRGSITISTSGDAMATSDISWCPTTHLH